MWFKEKSVIFFGFVLAFEYLEVAAGVAHHTLIAVTMTHYTECAF